MSAVVTDATVPEGHVGLHSALYGTGTSDSADVHVSRHSYRAVEVRVLCLGRVGGESRRVDTAANCPACFFSTPCSPG
jgi:hypothetical protein